MHLDWADEECEAVAIRLASYQQRTMAHYNKRACPRLFYPSDMDLRRVFENIVEIGAIKLHPNWVGPYVVHKMGKAGAYHLQTLDITPLFLHWNVENLKKYYQ